MAFRTKTSTTSSADVLAQKKSRLDSYNAQFDKAVSLITDTIQEIDDYQRELAETKDGLTVAREKNERVIANFQALLNVG